MYFDVVMPFALFVVVLVAVFLNGKVEGKLKGVFEEREFQMRDVVLFAVFVGLTVSIVVFVPQFALIAVFLFAYSALLFTFSYVFSGVNRSVAQLLCSAVGVVCVVAALGVSMFMSGGLTVYAVAAFAGLAVFAFACVFYEFKRVPKGERWYLAVLPPILFVLLYMFYGGTQVWFPYLLDAYAVVFAVLIILYVGTLFNWKSTLVFALLFTGIDIVLVLVTGTMISAAKHVSGLGLPVLVSLPTLPLILKDQGLVYMSLGLGDFFFAGVLAVQTLKKFGRAASLWSILSMSVSFGLFEAFLLNSSAFRGFPGTLMIVCGWLPIVAWKTWSKKQG
jgi:hypothetical protein